MAGVIYDIGYTQKIQTRTTSCSKHRSVALRILAKSESTDPSHGKSISLLGVETTPELRDRTVSLGYHVPEPAGHGTRGRVPAGCDWSIDRQHRGLFGSRGRRPRWLARSPAFQGSHDTYGRHARADEYSKASEEAGEGEGGSCGRGLGQGHRVV